MTTDDALAIVDRFLQSEQLNNLQELIFRQSWQGVTYQEIAKDSGYTYDYVRDNGAELWKLLSRIFEERITKKNFKAVLERYFRQEKTESIDCNQDWEEAIDVSFFCGRNQELDTLQKWIVCDRCRLIGIFGIGGIGKTSLTVKLAQEIESEFDFIIWRSLKNAPPLDELLASIIQFLSNQQEIERNLPQDIGSRISKLIEYLKSARCLLILDNGETILQSGLSCGRYRPGHEDYGELLKRIGEISHQSCMVLTSREKPKEFIRLEGNCTPVRSLQITGLEAEIGKEICQLKGECFGSEKDWQTLTYNYSGNPLAFKIVASTIKELFDGDVSQFLQQEIISFDDIEDLLTEQLDRLSSLEQEIMYWLAIEREAVTLKQLQEDLLTSIPQKKLLEAMKSLQRRSLIEKTITGFTQQPVVMEYLIEQQIEKVATEIATATPDLLASHALIKAQTQEYIRQIQTRVTLKPLADKLIESYDDLTEIESKLRQIIEDLKKNSDLEIGYAVGNIINLLQQLEIDLSNYDFSDTSIRQAHLRNLDLHHVKLNNCHLQDSVFSESTDFVFDLAFNSTGDILASGHQNGDINLWSIPSCKKILSWKAHNDWFDSLVFSPDDQTIASASKDEEIKLWSSKTGRLLKTLPIYISPFSNLVFYPNSQILTCATLNRNIQFWDVNTGECLRTLAIDRGRILSIAISPDGYSLVCGYFNGTIEIWNLSTYECTKTLHAHSSAIFSIVISSDGKSLFSGCIDNTVKQWDLETGTCLRDFLGHTNQIQSIDLSPEDNILATASLDNTIRIWNIKTGQCLNVLQDHNNTIYATAFNPNGQILASGGMDYSVRLWSIPSGKSFKTLQGYQTKIWSIAFSPDGQTLASGSDDSIVRLWNINTGQCYKAYRSHTSQVVSVAWHPDGKLLASSDFIDKIKLWDLNTDRCLETLCGHTDWVPSVIFSPDGRFLASGGRDRRVNLWDAYTGEYLKNIFEGDNMSMIWSLAFHPDSSILAGGGHDSTIKLWNIHTGRHLKTLSGHKDFITSVTFSSQEIILASSSYDSTIRIWNFETGECIKTLLGHTNTVWSVAFSPDGSILASAGIDQTIKLWDMNTGQCFKVLEEHQKTIMSVCFNPEGTILASGDHDGKIKLWDVATGECLRTLQPPRIYEEMEITGITGLTVSQKDTLKALGAFETLD